MSKEKERKATTRKTRAVQSMSVVQQSLTTEERARAEAEAMISEYASNSHISREYYIEGYLSGYHSRDEEVKELRSVEGVDFHIKSNKYQHPRHCYDHSSMLEDFKRDVLSQLEENFFFYFPVKQHHNRMEGSIEYQTTLYFLPDNN